MQPKTKASDFNLANVHAPHLCQGRHCIVHNPVEHHMEGWPLSVRQRGFTLLWERTCTHGVGHPDPSQFDYWKETGGWPTEEIHGCCGCCLP